MIFITILLVIVVYKVTFFQNIEKTYILKKVFKKIKN